MPASADRACAGGPEAEAGADAVVDVAVVGAGPAGLAAAVTAATAGCSVVLIDQAERLGGQYFRRPPPELHPQHRGRPSRAGKRAATLERTVGQLAAAGRLRHLPATSVWLAEPGEPVRLHTRGPDRDPIRGLVSARTVVIATGAYDRQVPFPGWELPGVLAGGGAQALAKSNLVAAGQVAVVAGTGPFLLPVATSLLAAGVRVRAVVEANEPLTLGRHPRALLGTAHTVAEAAGYFAMLARHRVRYLRRHRVIAAHGRDRVERVTLARVDPEWTVRPGSERTVECDTLAVGYGFLAQLDLPLQLGCQTALGSDGGLAVLVDGDQETSARGVFAAGEVTGVGGVDLSLVEGRLAGSAAVRACGADPLDPATRARLRRQRARRQAFAAALHAAFPLAAGWADGLDAGTLVCRCEEVPYARLRIAVTELGGTDPRTAKLLTRAGMGWCQGRVCGYPVGALCARLGGSGDAASAPAQAAAAQRPVAAPVPLAALAALDRLDDLNDLDEPDEPPRPAR